MPPIDKKDKKKIKALINKLAIPLLPHDEVQMADLMASNAGIEQMWWAFLDEHQQQVWFSSHNLCLCMCLCVCLCESVCVCVYLCRPVAPHIADPCCVTS